MYWNYKWCPCAFFFFNEQSTTFYAWEKGIFYSEEQRSNGHPTIKTTIPKDKITWGRRGWQRAGLVARTVHESDRQGFCPYTINVAHVAAQRTIHQSARWTA